MSEHSRPTIHDIAVVFAHLADRVAGDRGPSLDPLVSASITRAVFELKRHIPGLDPAPDLDAAKALATASVEAMRRGRGRLALARALRGLSFAPHHPELHYLAGSACFELGAVQEGIRLLDHAVWVHPGYEPARRDLDAMSGYREPAPVEDSDDENADGPRPRFEMLDDEPWRQGDLGNWEHAEGDTFPDDGPDDRDKAA
jgi:hypothetical protein